MWGYRRTQWRQILTMVYHLWFSFISSQLFQFGVRTRHKTYRSLNDDIGLHISNWKIWMYRVVNWLTIRQSALHSLRVGDMGIEASCCNNKSLQTRSIPYSISMFVRFLNRPIRNIKFGHLACQNFATHDSTAWGRGHSWLSCDLNLISKTIYVWNIIGKFSVARDWKNET